MKLTHIICDKCGNEITAQNQPIKDNDGDYFPTNIETPKKTASLSISIYPLDGVTEIDLCKHCILNAFRQFNDS